MTPRLILEVLDGRATVRTRARIDTLPATIGRGYANDLIVDDPYVSPTHVRIVEDDGGELVAEDADSVNGLYQGRGRERLGRIALKPGTELRIGRTTIRCCDPAQPVPPALVDGRGTVPGRSWLATPAARALAIGGSLVLLGIAGYTGSIERTGGVNAVGQSIAFLILLAIWAGLWALASRAVSHRFAFTFHLAFASLVAAAVTVCGTITDWIDFFAPSGTPSAIFAIPVGLALVAVLIYGHLGIASTMPRTQRLRAALGGTGVLVAIFMLFWMVGNEKFTTKMDYEAQLKPVPAAFVPTVSVDRFVADARSLRDDVDEMASDTSASGR
jgi:hypothetical protein